MKLKNENMLSAYKSLIDFIPHSKIIVSMVHMFYIDGHKGRKEVLTGKILMVMILKNIDNSLCCIISKNS